jgi:hypothetical protein
MLKPVSKTQIEIIVEDGVNAMYAAIQEKMGQTDGGVAGVYHSGSEVEAMLVKFFQEYVKTEIRLDEADEEDEADAEDDASDAT